MTRRDFLPALAAAAAAPAASAGAIDAHTHFYDPARPQGVPWPPRADAILYRTTLPARLRQLAEPLGVSGTVVIEASPWLEDNQWLLDLAKDEPFIVGVAGNLDPGAAEFARHLERFARNRRFRGIRVNARRLAEGMAQPAFLAGMDRLAGLDLELDAVGGPEMFPPLLRLNDRLPRLRVVIDHLPFDPPVDRAAMRELGGRAAVFAKVSWILRRRGERVPVDVESYRPALDDVWAAFGPDRVLYGSNWPVSDRFAPYAAVHRIAADYFNAKGPAAAARYFRENSRAAYRW